jgi:hypothetical protein
MSTGTDVQPWLSDELPPPKTTKLLDELRAVFPKVWSENPRGTFRQAVTSTCDENSRYGSVAMDRAYVAMCLYEAAEPGSLAEASNPAVINSKMTHVAKPFGKDRAAIAAQRAEFAAIQSAEPIGEQAEPSSNERRDVANERRDEANGSPQPE